MDRKRRRWTDWKMAALLLAVLIAAFLMLGARKDPAPYKFLEGHEPVATEIEDRNSSTLWESKYYQWDADLYDLLDQIHKELQSKGFKGRAYNVAGQFQGPHGESIMVYKIAKKSGNKWKFGGCTITVRRVISNNLLTKLRRFLRRE